MFLKNNIALIVFLFLVGCGQDVESVEKSSSIGSHKALELKDSIEKKTIKKKLTKAQKRQQYLERKTRDSIRFELVKKDAFKVGKRALGLEYFSERYEMLIDSSYTTTTIDISVGNLFNDQQKYFLLREYPIVGAHVELYRITDRDTIKLIESKQENCDIKDTIFDANGDGYNDFLVHWYSSSGCCRRNVYDVYLNQPQTGRFTKPYEFMNPTFSPKEKIIRGVGYGHPGEVGMYKYRWNGLQVDTIEFIYPDVTKKGRFIKTKRSAYRPRAKEGIVLKKVPKEYHTIESYDWFTYY